jgi:hypothetical protein
MTQYFAYAKWAGTTFCDIKPTVNEFVARFGRGSVVRGSVTAVKTGRPGR